MKILFLAIGYIDGYLLLATLHVREFVVGWLGISRTVFERTLIAGYLLPQLWLVWAEHLGWGWNVMFVLISAAMWRRQREPEQARARRFHEPGHTVLRVGIAVFVVLNVLLDLALPPRTGPFWWANLAMASFTAFEFAMSLPGGGERGRRAKMALDKVRALFGTGWQVAPLPVAR